ncbi:zinc finger, CCHC-type containing protein [Tanacetum coccineum]
MDVKTAFLNGDLEEEIYMKQPEGFVMPDKCVYCKFDESGKGVIICLYVDDMLIFGTDQTQVDKTKEFLSSNFSMKDMGEAYVILGIRIKRENKGLAITQSHYIEKILKKFNCEGCGPVSTPMEAGIKLVPHMGKPVNKLEYSRAIGCLMYAMTSTRPDIAYAVRKLSRFTSNPSNHHWEAIIRVFRYLKKTMNYGLSYFGFPSVIEGYSNASWITNSEDHTSTTGWVFLLGGGAISWASKKQTCITDSTMESEFVALAAAGKEAEWLRNLIYEIPLWPKPISPISMHCDSAATLAKAYSQIYNGKSRHLGVRHSMVRELITNGVISVDFVRSQQNLADHLTKGLARDLVHKSAIGMGLKCKTKRTTYVSMECRRFKKLGLGFLYAHEGYGHKALFNIKCKVQESSISGLQVQEMKQAVECVSDEEIKRIIESTYGFRQRIQEVLPAESSFYYDTPLEQEMNDDLEYVNSLEKELDELESEKADFSNIYDLLLEECVSKDVTCSYLHSLSDLNANTELQCLYLHKVKECECLAQKLSKQTESVNKEVHNNLLKSFSKLEKHSISLELALQHCKEQMKNNPVCKENGSNVFRKEREQYHEIQDLKAQMQDKSIAISGFPQEGTSFNGQKQQRIDITADALYNEKQENLRVWLLKFLSFLPE